MESWFKLHLFREARGFNYSEVVDHLEANPQLATFLGFRDDSDEYGPKETKAKAEPPGYTQVRKMWEDEFTDRMRGSCKVIAERLVSHCRDHGVPAPDKVFTPEPDVEVEDPDEDEPTVRELTTEKTGEVWQHARPMVLKHWGLKRHHNWQVPEATFFDAHAYLATESDDVFPESRLGNMDAKSDHDRVHFPSTHRRELKKFDIDEIRELHRSVTENLIREARHEGELVGKLEVAIDQTKGHPWTGEVEHNADGSNAEDWILGYKNDNDQRTQYYFQWASVRIVGLDIPLVLDAVPVHRGYSRGDIVDDLLRTATEMVDDIKRVHMDADYDSEAVKNAAEKHGVIYNNRKSRDIEDKRRMRQMWENGEAVRIVEEEDRYEMPTRKKIYVPHIAVDDNDSEEDDQGDSLRQELLSDFSDAGGAEMPEKSPFESLLDDMREEEKHDKEDVDGAEKYVVFETNDPLADRRGAAGRDSIPKSEQRHAAARMVRKYGRRWGIENGYKKLGHFLPRTGSKDHALRFFGFAFAATLYNCWRLVDLLVKASVEDNPDYTPLVTASRFLAVAEGMFGLETKPPPN
jgi:IS4 transposase